MTCSRNWFNSIGWLDFIPSIIKEGELENIISPLAILESSEDDHRIVLKDTRMLIPGSRKVALIILESLSLHNGPLVLDQV